MKVLIFDFDGTIANTLDALLSISNRLAKEYGYPIIDAKTLSHLQNLSSREIIRESKIPFLKIPFLMRRLRVELNQDIEAIEPISEVELALRRLKELGHSLGIVTSNSSDNVYRFLDNHNLRNLFDFIYSGTTIFGKHRVISRLIKKHRLNPKEIIYVGDETRDIEAAKKVEIDVVAVSWGFNSKEVLQKYHPTFLIDHPYELIKIASHST